MSVVGAGGASELVGLLGTERAGEEAIMKNQPAKTSGWTNTQVYTAIIVVLILGGLGGYLLKTSSSSPESSSLSSSSSSLPPPGMPSQSQMLSTQAAPLQARLQANPKDTTALIELGNLYFDAQQFSDAIGYYTRALNENPNDPNVRTDMGIAYYYSGDPDRALKEFDRSLKTDPRHSQTLFNVGVVKLQGKNDPKGAIAAWEELLRIDPRYRDRARVESLLAEARTKAR
jgi:cytochrome c-type biogenesis protein CcmH/NrfG